jgi:hypothetical protein
MVIRTISGFCRLKIYVTNDVETFIARGRDEVPGDFIELRVAGRKGMSLRGITNM